MHTHTKTRKIETLLTEIYKRVDSYARVAVGRARDAGDERGKRIVCGGGGGVSAATTDGARRQKNGKRKKKKTYI